MRISDWSSDVCSSDLYRFFDERYPFLFNSYYEAEGERHARPRRGMLTRPSLDEVLAYRAHVDAAVAKALPDLSEDARFLVMLGLQHEQQHQELLLTDIQHLFAQNQIGRASCRERVCQYGVDLGGRRLIKKKNKYNQ